MILVETGLFIGVDSYSNLNADQQLNGSASALKMRGYFESLMPNGSWLTPLNQCGARATRLEVIDAFRSWVAKVKPNSAGIIYFGGHGLVLPDKGLVLACTDFLPRLALDSGIPLTRLVELVEEVGDESATFLLICDTCRLRDDVCLPTTLPKNVGLVFSCKSGGAAIENPNLSAFVDSFLRSFASCNKVRKGTQIYCAMDDLLAKQSILIREVSGGLVEGIEFQGVALQQIFAPSSEVDFQIRKQFTTSLQTRTMSREMCRVLNKRLHSCIGAISSDLHEPKHFLKVTEDRQSRSFLIEVKLPDVPFAPSCSVLNFFLTECPSVFESLRIRWDVRRDAGFFRRLAAANGLTMKAISSTDWMCSWNEDNYEGRALARTAPKTSLDVWCHPRNESYKYFLEYLPSVCPLFSHIVTTSHS